MTNSQSFENVCNTCLLMFAILKMVSQKFPLNSNFYILILIPLFLKLISLKISAVGGKLAPHRSGLVKGCKQLSPVCRRCPFCLRQHRNN